MRLKNTLRRGVAAAVIAGIVVTSGLPVYAKTWDISEGSITVEADGEEDGKSYNKVTQGDKETVRDTDTVITGKSEKNTVTIKSGGGQTSDVTLKDVSIKSDKDAALKVEGDGNVRLELDGKNELKSGANHAGVEKNNSDSKGTLTIKDDTGEKGSLTATGGAQGAGIGGAKNNSGSNIEITGGTITATGGCNNNEAGNGGAAGIGGGFNGSGTDIKITGGNVTANGSRKPDGTSGCQGAGIGGGYGKGGTNISISGEDTVVNATAASMALASAAVQWVLAKTLPSAWRSCNSQRWCTGCRHWRAAAALAAMAVTSPSAVTRPMWKLPAAATPKQPVPVSAAVSVVGMVMLARAVTSPSREARLSQPAVALPAIQAVERQVSAAAADMPRVMTRLEMVSISTSRVMRM